MSDKLKKSDQPAKIALFLFFILGIDFIIWIIRGSPENDVFFESVGIIFGFLAIGFGLVALAYSFNETTDSLNKEFKRRKLKKRREETERKEKAELEQENIIKKAENYAQKGGMENLIKASNLYLGDLADKTPLTVDDVNKRNERIPFEHALAIIKEHEKLLDYDSALKGFKALGKHEDAKRVRQKMMEKGSVKVTQKVVHGDEVTKTEIKDSVVSKSNIGSGGDDKFTKLKELKEMLSEGLIDEDEFKQMKKEILGK